MAQPHPAARVSAARSPDASMPVVNRDAAAIDVHCDNHVVCVPADRAADHVRTFGADSCDLLEIVAWLQQCGVATVAVESTGI